MKIRPLFFLAFAVVCFAAFAAVAQDQERSELESARASYRSTVKEHGQQSAEAATARNKLRSARRSYHNSIRQQRRSENPGARRPSGGARPRR
jgi:Flp pilus assembly protein TadB